MEDGPRRDAEPRRLPTGANPWPQWRLSHCLTLRIGTALKVTPAICDAQEFIAPQPIMPSNPDFLLSTDPEEPPERLAGAVVAIGNFDGVHRGHRAVIARAKALARRLARPCAILTFEPHPVDFFGRGDAVFRLTSRDAKAHRIAELGLDGMFVLTFDKALANLDAGEFLREILVRRLGVAAVVVGYDFHFGARRTGTPEFLREAAPKLGIAVEIVEKVVADEEGSLEAVSSTATREALERGDVRGAAVLLGHLWSLTGTVIHGAKLGRQLGFPTANLAVEDSAACATPSTLSKSISMAAG